MVGALDDDHPERWIEVDGRRWRTSDPSIPAALRAELVAELMSARRAVAAGSRAGDEEAVRAARGRVHDAKVALGERGRPWWEDRAEEAQRDRLAAAVRTLARHRAPEGTTCPSDAARAVGGTSWRQDMDLVRDVVREQVRLGNLRVEQGGRPLAVDEPWRGPIRVRL